MSPGEEGSDMRRMGRLEGRAVSWSVVREPKTCGLLA